MMNLLTQLHSVGQFMQQGGPVMWVLAALLVIFLSITIERLMFIYVYFPHRRAFWIQKWAARNEWVSWFAHGQKNAWLEEASQELKRHLNILKMLVTLFPMLGLLGTVTGMISVFDVMALQGNAEPKLMAAGISKATLPTMAGMVSALIGLFLYARVEKLTQKKHFQLEQDLQVK